MRSLAQKRRTRGHVIADLSVNYFEKQVLLCGHTTERVTHDYGYDLLWFTFNSNGEPEPGEIRLQIKASENLSTNLAGDIIPFRIQRSHLAQWLNETSLVVLALYDAQRDLGYWLDVKAYFGQLAGFNLFSAAQNITIGIPIANVVNVGAIEQLATLKIPR